MRKALVLGHDTRAFLACVRSLGRAGIEVHAAACPPGTHARRSRYLARVHDLPLFSPPGGLWIAALNALVEREGFDFILPCADPTLVPLHHARDRLLHVERYALPPPRAFEILFDKAKTTALARSLGIPVPDERPVTDGEELESALRDLGLPVMVKPHSSFSPERPGERHVVRRHADAGAARAHARRILARDGSVILQAAVPGRGLGVEVLCRDGEVLLAFAHLRLREPAAGGGSSYRLGIRAPSPLVAEAGRLCRAAGHTGVAMLEYRVDPATGARHLLEVNGRFWGALPLAVASGADFPAALFALSVGGRLPAAAPPRAGLRARHLFADLSELLLLAKRGGWRDLLRAVAREGIGALLGLERIDTLALDDPAPFLSECREITTWAVARARAAFDWHGFERDPASAAARILAATRTARRVLFLCKGNVCRSPFAERSFAAAAGARFIVTSAGHHPESGRPCPPAAVEAAAACGVDLAAHRSRVVTREALLAADLVLVFDAENHRAAVALAPEARPRILPLGALDGDPVVGDPWGEGVAGFAACYRRLAALAERLAAEADRP